jgi:hypothetical protein
VSVTPHTRQLQGADIPRGAGRFSSQQLRDIADEVDRLATPIATYLLMWLWTNPEPYHGKGPR